jgi:hypothetical protein
MSDFFLLFKKSDFSFDLVIRHSTTNMFFHFDSNFSLKYSALALILLVPCAEMFRVLTNKIGVRRAQPQRPEVLNYLQAIAWFMMAYNLWFGVPGFFFSSWEDRNAQYVALAILHIPLVVALSLLAEYTFKVGQKWLKEA